MHGRVKSPRCCTALCSGCEHAWRVIPACRLPGRRSKQAETRASSVEWRTKEVEGWNAELERRTRDAESRAADAEHRGQEAEARSKAAEVGNWPGPLLTSKLLSRVNEAPMGHQLQSGPTSTCAAWRRMVLKRRDIT